jgi:hypothetical protein
MPEGRGGLWAAGEQGGVACGIAGGAARVTRSSVNLQSAPRCVRRGTQQAPNCHTGTCRGILPLLRALLCLCGRVWRLHGARCGRGTWSGGCWCLLPCPLGPLDSYRKVGLRPAFNAATSDDGSLMCVQLVQGRSTKTPRRLTASSAMSLERPEARGTLHSLPCGPRTR